MLHARTLLLPRFLSSIMLNPSHDANSKVVILKKKLNPDDDVTKITGVALHLCCLKKFLILASTLVNLGFNGLSNSNECQHLDG
ncbi:hypothetical protein H5410_003602 [Solanum commersonii]|uniref:Uncharacterized protein n=1 Tax=Solanum commersonii TaxID=4109 RepID=A0A9J6B540_SOLCO|nr:hypothetical protein H5410_003602 [Solanum commersonii]